MKKLTKYFLEGLLFLVPVAVTVYVLYAVFVRIDRLFRFDVPGIGFALTLLLVTAVGFVASNVLTKGLVHVIDIMFGRLPLAKMIYSSIKDLIGAFVGEKKGFNRPVLVTLGQGSGIQVLGFVTRESLENLGVTGSVAVYLPQSYNFAGNLLIVRSELVTPISADSGTLMTFIVSGGITAQ